MNTMEGMIHWLEEKNEFLGKFYALNSEELQRFSQGEFEHLESFYQSREALLEMIQHADGKLAAMQDGVSPDLVTVDLRRKVEQALARKEQLVNDILAQDLQIISMIDVEKSNIIRDLRKVSQVRTAFEGYRAPQPSKRVDEKY